VGCLGCEGGAGGRKKIIAKQVRGVGLFGSGF